MESNIEKTKKAKESVEEKLKVESEKFMKYKLTTNKELQSAKKSAVEKERAVKKLQQDLKKADQKAQEKLMELKGLQRRAKEEKMKRERQNGSIVDANGVDFEAIKEWISENTDKMLQNKDVKESMEVRIFKVKKYL